MPKNWPDDIGDVMTKQSFITAYKAVLVDTFPWTNDAEKLARFMQAVNDAIYTTSTSWQPSGQVAAKAWKQLGGKGKPTLKILRALP